MHPLTLAGVDVTDGGVAAAGGLALLANLGLKPGPCFPTAMALGEGLDGDVGAEEGEADH